MCRDVQECVTNHIFAVSTSANIVGDSDKTSPFEPSLPTMSHAVPNCPIRIYAPHQETTKINSILSADKVGYIRCLHYAKTQNGANRRKCNNLTKCNIEHINAKESHSVDLLGYMKFICLLRPR